MKTVGLFALALGIVLFSTSSIKALTSSISVSAVVPSTNVNSGNLRLTGYASPNALVTFLQQGVVVSTSVANSSSFFDNTINNIDSGTKTFSIFASDQNGRTTLTLSFDTLIIAGSTITLSGFLLPPTISVTKTVLKRPEVQSSSGVARQGATVTAFFNSNPISKQVSTTTSGSWTASVPETFDLGSHTTNALVQDADGGQSIVSQTLGFTVILSADLNNDNLINLTDFSIMMFNYGQSNFSNKAADINDDTKVDLVDFSVMMFNWTGG